MMENRYSPASLYQINFKAPSRIRRRRSVTFHIANIQFFYDKNQSNRFMSQAKTWTPLFFSFSQAIKLY